MKEKKKSDLAILLEYAGSHKALTFIGLGLSGIAMVFGMVPYLYIWLAARDLIAVAPNWQQATHIVRYGWLALLFAILGILIYFGALMCTHLAAFRTASNMRKQGMAKLLKAPLGYFDNHASGLLRNRLMGATGDTETLMAHNLADIVGTVAMFLSMLVLLFVFDWRMGLACLIAAVISILAMSSMMAGKNANLMNEYQQAQDVMSKAGTEYVRGIPVVKVFQQTVDSFKAFKESIDAYSEKAGYYQGVVCRIPQAINLTFTEGAFIFLVPVALFLAPRANETNILATFITNYAFYAVFSAIISTTLAKIMFAASGMMLASTALNRMKEISEAPILEKPTEIKEPKDNSIEFKDVTFQYEGSLEPALKGMSFRINKGETVAMVGPSGSGKTTAARLIPRFWDVQSGEVLVGDVNVKEMNQATLMEQIAFVFQNNHLFKTSIFENVRISKPNATREEVQKALEEAQCMDILEKLENGMDTLIGSEGTYLSGGEGQRILLARAILKDAPIVILDEATAFADPENEALIQKAFARLAHGKTVLMIAHRLSTVVNADRILVLDNGQIVEEGTHEELVALNGLYTRMWKEYNKAANWKLSTNMEVA